MISIQLSSLMLLAFFTIAILASPAQAEQKCYVDRGKEICFPLGEASFADKVVQFDVGKPAPQFITLTDSAMVIGADPCVFQF